VKVAILNIINFLRHLSDITTDLMTDAVRLEQHRRIKRRRPVKQRKSETHLRRYTDKFCQGGYPNALDIYLLSVLCYQLRLHKLSPTLITFATFVGAQRESWSSFCTLWTLKILSGMC